MTRSEAEQLRTLYEAKGRSATACASALGVSQRTARRRIAKMRRVLGENPELRDPEDLRRENRLNELLEGANIPQDALEKGYVSELVVNEWGDQRDPNRQTKVYYRFPRAGKAQWPPIAPYYVVEAKAYEPLPHAPNEFQRVFVWGDTQAHFWREGSNLVPFHDEAAIDVGLQALARYKPHKVVILGDMLDLPGLGRYRKEPAFAFLMNAAIAYVTHLLARIRGIVGPDCEIVFIPGNHEMRLQVAILENLMELYGIKRPGDAFSLLSIPFLLQFERFGIKCAEQYPSGEVWLADDLVCMHKPDRTVAATQICGHLVRGTVESGSLHFRDGRRTFKTFIVPGFGDYGRKPKDRERVQRTNIPSHLGRSGAEQAFATIDITPDGKRHSVRVWDIENGGAFFRETFLQGVAEGWEYDEAA